MSESVQIGGGSTEKPWAAARFVVVGAGAVGGVLAAQLVEAGRDVLLVARGEHGAAIAAEGLRVRRPGRVDVVGVPVAAGPGQVRLAPGDVLLLTTKTQDADAALTEWAAQPVAGVGIAADLPIVTFQNGLATEDLALRRFANVYGATVGVAASYLTPGEIISPSLSPVAGLIWLGRHPSGVDDVATGLAADLTAAGFAAWTDPWIGSVKAAKLVANSGNGLDLLEGPAEQRQQARTALRQEAIDVLDAAGRALPPNAELDRHGVDLAVLPVEGHVAGRLSTWQSHARGASSEIDFLNGEIVLQARLHGLSAPLSERLQRQLTDPAQPRTLTHLLAAAPAQSDGAVPAGPGSSHTAQVAGAGAG